MAVGIAVMGVLVHFFLQGKLVQPEEIWSGHQSGLLQCVHNNTYYVYIYLGEITQR